MRTNENSAERERKEPGYPTFLDEDALRPGTTEEKSEDLDEDPREEERKRWHNFETC